MEKPDTYIAKLLQLHGLNATAPRISVISLLLREKRWFDLPEIQKHVNAGRITVYRILNVLLDKEIIRKIVDVHNKVFYCFNDQNPFFISTSSRKKEAIYFRCSNCNEIFVLKRSHIDIHLPKNFTKTGTNLFITGYCNHCAGTA
ncbi:MAG TPA: transcriptional repressor [Chitinophagaceae bacterium]|nr:transcriptional repressor [Chitinophagaceae bacterium]